MGSLIRDIMGVVAVVVVVVLALTVALDLWGAVDVMGILRQLAQPGFSLFGG